MSKDLISKKTIGQFVVSSIAHLLFIVQYLVRQFNNCKARIEIHDSMAVDTFVETVDTGMLAFVDKLKNKSNG